LGQFTGPQSFNARYNQLQGQQAKAAADTLGRVHNQNVGISNQQEAQNAQIMNNASLNRAGLATSLWDKYQTVNQQFDVDKSRAINALGQQYANAITNRAYTHNLNEMYPQFAIDPSTGGNMIFHNPRSLNPDTSTAPTFNSVLNKLLEDTPVLRNDPKTAADIAMKLMGMTTPTEDEFTKYQRSRQNSQIPSYPGAGPEAQQ
jgi:hypothetical protein